MFHFSIKPGDTPTDRDVELGFSGSAETLAAESLCFISTMYFRLKEQDGDEAANWFKRLVIRGLTTHSEPLWADPDGVLHYLAAAFERDQEQPSD